VILVVLLASAFATVPLAGGRLGALLELRFRAAWLLGLASVCLLRRRYADATRPI